MPAGQPVVTGTIISSTTHNNTMSDIASEMTNSVDKDGQTVLTGIIDHNGNNIILDTDGDTLLDLGTDDQVGITIAGAEDFLFLANIFRALSGSVLETNTINETTAASGVTIDGVVLKDSGITATGTAATGALTVTGGITATSESTISAPLNVTIDTEGRLYVRDVLTLSTGVNISSVNSANSAFRPLEISASEILMAAPVTVTGATILSSTLGVSGDITTSARLILGGESELTIATGVITITGSIHMVDTEGDASTDDLDTISGFADGGLLVLRAIDDTHTVVLKDGTGNLLLAGDFSLTHRADSIILGFTAALNQWYEISRSDNNT